MSDKPHIVFVFGDQWRGQAVGYAGDPNVKTPNIDKLAERSVNFYRAVSGCPVCSPYRASLMTGQFPLTHGVFVNDVPLEPKGKTFAECFKDAGYDTAYIGKWHINDHGRTAYIPPERRRGFDYWKVLECTHNYNESCYYANDDPTKRLWEGYDAIAQTKDAIEYLENPERQKRPFLLMLSWGPPHNPYHTAPEKYKDMYQAEEIVLPPNVPQDFQDEARKMLAGYYAHCTALDDCIGDLLKALEENGQIENTIFIFTSDHGDLVGSHGQTDKQRPYEECISVPFLLHYPALHGRDGQKMDAPIDAPDIMPTLLGLSELEIPDSVEGLDYSAYLRGGENPSDGMALLQCPHPFGNWERARGGREYRGIRSERYTYVRDLVGPFMLFDNYADPYQQNNLVGRNGIEKIIRPLDEWLEKKLDERGDTFKPGMEYVREWGYEVNEKGTIDTSR
ncbi:MAG: sulfatase [Candidatus Sumerlaeota bacterium]